MVNVWECLLKARILLDNQNRLKAIYVIDKKVRKSNGTPYKHPKYKKNRAGNCLTLNIFSYLNKLDIDEVLRENIELLTEIRDNAIHFYNESKFVTTHQVSPKPEAPAQQKQLVSLAKRHVSAYAA